MSQLKFTKAKVSAIVTTIGDRKVELDDYRGLHNFTDEDIQKFKVNLGIKSRYIVSDKSITTSDLCVNSAENILRSLDIDPKSIDAILFVSQTPDYRAPSTAIHIGHRLGCSNHLIAFDISLGCSGYVYGLSVAHSFIESGLKRVLLLTGDVASHFISNSDKTFAPLMGDAGSATLVEQSESTTESAFCMFSDGAGYKALIIPGSGTRKADNIDLPDNIMHMNGAEVFNFTIKTVPSMFTEIFNYSNLTPEEIDYFVLHQPNKYILNNIRKRLKVPVEKLPDQTQSIFGNQNSASIPGTINGFLNDAFNSQNKSKVIMAGFGIGLSWAACYINLSSIYSPEPLLYKVN